MAQSRLQIKNGALAACKADRIESEDEASLSVETVAQHYQPALELLLDDHDWDFAIRRATLAIVTNDRANEPIQRADISPRPTPNYLSAYKLVTTVARSSFSEAEDATVGPSDRDLTTGLPTNAYGWVYVVGYRSGQRGLWLSKTLPQLRQRSNLDAARGLSARPR